MNNLMLGTDDFTYYETLGGGQGACADADGPSAVHVAMSNTLNTPVEALELEFPLRVSRYAVRRGSGGAGAHRGGDGVVREYEALDRRCSSRCSPSAAATRRRAPTAASRARRGRNLLDGEELPPKASGHPAAASGCGSRRPAAADVAGSPMGFVGLGIMGSRRRRTCAAPGSDRRSTTARARPPTRWSPSMAPTSPRAPPGRRRALRRRPLDGRRRRPGRARAPGDPTVRSTGRRRRRCSSTVDHRPADAADRRPAGRARRRIPRRARHGLLPEAADRTLTIMAGG